MLIIWTINSIEILSTKSSLRQAFILKLLLCLLQFRCSLFSIKCSETFQHLISLSPPLCNVTDYRCVMKLYSYSGRLLKHPTIVQRNYRKCINISVEQVLLQVCWILRKPPWIHKCNISLWFYTRYTTFKEFNTSSDAFHYGSYRALFVSGVTQSEIRKYHPLFFWVSPFDILL